MLAAVGVGGANERGIGAGPALTGTGNASNPVTSSNSISRRRTDMGALPGEDRDRTYGNVDRSGSGLEQLLPVPRYWPASRSARAWSAGSSL